MQLKRQLQVWNFLPAPAFCKHITWEPEYLCMEPEICAGCFFEGEKIVFPVFFPARINIPPKKDMKKAPPLFFLRADFFFFLQNRFRQVHHGWIRYQILFQPV
jgi:hypothetical protein